VLVISAREFPRDRGEALARRYDTEWLSFPWASHWDLVLDPAVRRAVATWLSGSR
jgi:hypothetical protein